MVVGDSPQESQRKGVLFIECSMVSFAFLMVSNVTAMTFLLYYNLNNFLIFLIVKFYFHFFKLFNLLFMSIL